MAVASNRREFLQTAAVGAIGLSLPAAGCGGSAPAASLPVTRLAENIVMIAGAGANVVAARAGDSIVMVDGGAAEHADDLARTVAAEMGGDAQTLFNTHWHADQTGSNERLGRAGAKIIAHANTKQWLGSEIHVRWQDKTYPPLPDDALPTDTFYDAGEMAFGDGRIEYGYMLLPHTDGDIYVRFPEANVLVAGGALTSDRWPVVDWWTGGYVGALLDAHQTLLGLADDETRIVPSDGPVMTRAELEEQAAMYVTIFDRLATMLKDSYGPADAVAARPTEGFKEEWGDPDQFVELAFRSFFGHLRGNPQLGAIP